MEKCASYSRSVFMNWNLREFLFKWVVTHVKLLYFFFLRLASYFMNEPIRNALMWLMNNEWKPKGLNRRRNYSQKKSMFFIKNLLKLESSRFCLNSSKLMSISFFWAVHRNQFSSAFNGIGVFWRNFNSISTTTTNKVEIGDEDGDCK